MVLMEKERGGGRGEKKKKKRALPWLITGSLCLGMDKRVMLNGIIYGIDRSLKQSRSGKKGCGGEGGFIDY